MKNLLEYILIHLVEHPEDVKIVESTDEQGLLLTISVNQADMGRVIGKQGSVIKAIRTIMRIRGTKEGVRVYVTIADQNGGADESFEMTADASEEEAIAE